jgi:hypothetical protein
MQERWATSSQIREAEQALQKAKGDDPTRLAYIYVDQQTPTDTPLQTAQTALNAANSE